MFGSFMVFFRFVSSPLRLFGLLGELILMLILCKRSIYAYRAEVLFAAFFFFFVVMQLDAS